MFSCSRCGFGTELDDVVIRVGDARCLCLRCYERITETQVRLQKQFMRELNRLLNEIA